MEPLKNQFSFEKAQLIDALIKRAYPEFSLPRFNENLETAILPLGLKDRMRLIADRLEACLPTHPPELFRILVKSLEKEGSGEGRLKDFLVWPLTEIVARRGLSHHPEAMLALAEMTQLFTAEWALRPFIMQASEQTFAQLHRWCEHPSEHVRRLVSEGSRPFLPWGGNLPQLLHEPFPSLALLEKLHRDESDYVRLSVSNHLNDFSKKHPDLVIGILERWLAESPDDKRLLKLARHACRTLLKNGNPAALALHGYGSPDKLELKTMVVSPETLKLGGALQYELEIFNTGKIPVRVMFDFAIHHLKANGTHTAKVFKGRIGEIEAGNTWKISGKHPMKLITTRTYYPGLHRFEPRVNGKGFPMEEFFLEL